MYSDVFYVWENTRILTYFIMGMNLRNNYGLLNYLPIVSCLECARM